MAKVKVSVKGQIVIPAQVRHRHGIKPGGWVEILDFGTALVLGQVPDDPVTAMRGVLKSPRSVAELVAGDRREELMYEERKWAALEARPK